MCEEIPVIAKLVIVDCENQFNMKTIRIERKCGSLLLTFFAFAFIMILRILS